MQKSKKVLLGGIAAVSAGIGLYKLLDAKKRQAKPPSPVAPTLAFTNANLFDGTLDGELQENVTILVAVEPRGDAPFGAVEGTIVQIGPAGAVAIPDDARVIDLAGKYVVPG